MPSPSSSRWLVALALLLPLSPLSALAQQSASTLQAVNLARRA